MDYVNDVSMVMFTRGQVERMQQALHGPRSSLLSSDGLTPPVAPQQLEPLRELGKKLAALGCDDVYDGVGWVSLPQDAS